MITSFIRDEKRTRSHSPALPRNPSTGYERRTPLADGRPRPLPAPIVRAGEKAAFRFLEFFTANIRNRNTRRAYGQAVGQFFAWCEDKRLELNQLNPIVVAAYIEQHPAAAPTVKQHLAALRMLFDWLVIGQIMPVNTATSVRGPSHLVKKGMTRFCRLKKSALCWTASRFRKP